MRLSVLPSRAPAAALVVSSCATLVSIVAWLSFSRAGNHDDCTLSGELSNLAPAAQTEIARHELACRDFEHGRITTDDYRRLVGLIRDEAAKPVVETVEWASRVVAMSSQYSPSSWSAQQVLGPPDVYPGYGDNAKAWASLDADAGNEFIEVAFPRPTSMRELRIYETLNPGAIASVDATTVSGKHVTMIACGGSFTASVCDAPMAVPTGGAKISVVPLQCGEAIASVRVTLASAAVPGWNEIDAIGAVPCESGR